MAQIPKMAKKIAQDKKESIIPDWDSKKEDIMFSALYAKFTQHPELNRQLKETDKTILCEHTSDDTYWGDGGDGSGTNMLGILLMKLREQLLSS